LPSWTRSLSRIAVLGLVLVACGDSLQGPPDAPPRPQCHDNRDNDGDGKVDYPDDPGCFDVNDDLEEGPRSPACNDNRDNDRDGKRDYPADPGCIAPQSDEEDDDCPSGPNCPMCGNRVDDDANGMQDFPIDPGCASASDNFEYSGDPMACGASLTVKPLPITGVATGMLDATTTSNLTSPCGGGNGLPAAAYVMVLSKPKIVVISTTNSAMDTVLDLRRMPCSDPAAELACNDNASPIETTSRIVRALNPGAYYILVHGKTAAAIGPYTLRVQKLNGEDEECNVNADCGPGLVCRVPLGGTMKVCTGPVCADGRDDDADGKLDYPNDPGCVEENDTDETDDCPSGPNCPKCADGIDNDGDGNTDYPLDKSCKSAGDASEACRTSEKPIPVITTASLTGTTVGARNDYDPTCNSATGVAADLLYRLDLPTMATLNLTLNPASGFDAVHALLDSSCGGTPVACSDAPAMAVTSLAAGSYYVAVDAFANASGSFTLLTSGTVAPGGSCEGTLFQNGVITCANGFICDGPLGMRTCRADCADGVDNNGDGKIDFPNDPGCTAPSDPMEDTVCPGPLCPACSDGDDNDGDGQIDYPMDTGCKSAGGTNEVCGASEPIPDLTTAVTMGTTVGAANDYDPTCNSATGLAPDITYRLDIPRMATFNVVGTTTSGNTVATSLLNSTCGGTPVRCSTSTVPTALTNVAAGTYYVSIEGFNTVSFTYTITTSGTVAAGESCEGALFQSGAFTCEPGYVCGGMAGMRTCTSECSDTVDNNGDGRTDYPNDPGCTGLNDNLENTVCPGAMCPACSDEADNDNDGQIDYPNDSACRAANGTSELCVSTEPIDLITARTTAGTTVGAANDYDPTCNAAGALAPDVFYQLDVPQMATLNVVGTTTTGNTVATSLLNSTCSGTPIRCSTSTAPAALTNIAAGTYYVGIEGSATTSFPFTLTTSGTVVPGGSCEGVLFQSGAFTCTAGFGCNGPAGMRTCTPVQCNDTMDNNGDGKIDFPNDPGCSSNTDNTETTVCPGPDCPLCSDGIDNDSDGRTDYPMDTSCSAAGSSSEVCNGETDPIIVITSGTTNDTLAGSSNGHNPTQGLPGCTGLSSTSGSTGDKMYMLPLPGMATLTIDTEGSTGTTDTILSLMTSTCSEPAYACNDDDGSGFLSIISLTNVPGGLYVVAVDAWSSTTSLGAIRTNVSGTIAPGESCEGALFQSGAFTCTSGFSCLGPMGSRRCASECSDGVDNNTDGRIDFPNDPGCISYADLDEDTVCPGVTCPACGNMVDDDADGTIDYPADFGCTSASGPTEVFCSPDPDYQGPITMPVTSGTLAAPAADDREQSCQPNTGRDVVYALSSPIPASWVISTEGSTIADTVLSLWGPTCAAPELACDDDSASGAQSQITITLPAGNFAIEVDSYTNTGNNGPFQLNVRGTALPGADCTSPLFATGVLVCSGTQTCNAGICQ
jgi:large repetitive protein